MQWRSQRLDMPHLLSNGRIRQFTLVGQLQIFLGNKQEGCSGVVGRSNLVELFLNARVFTLGKQLLGFVTLATGLSNSYGWVLAVRQDFSLSMNR